MLGVVNLEQNNIIKLFSVMAMVLMPPTPLARYQSVITRESG
jgi:magnesium transporter